MSEEATPAHVSAKDIAGGHFRYFDYVMVAFVVILLLSNIIGASKRSVIDLPLLGPWPFGAGILFFPVSYVIGDVLTEVYGYARARRVIWAGFAAMLFMVLMCVIVVALPPDKGWTGQAAYEQVFGFGAIPRITLASICAFWAGEFVNSFVLARMKIWTRGKHLWSRTIGSTVFGEGVDSLDLLPARFPRRAGLDGAAGAGGAHDAMGAQGRVGSAADALHLPRRQLPQAPRGASTYTTRAPTSRRSRLGSSPPPRAAPRTAGARRSRHARPRYGVQGAASGPARCPLR